MFTVVASHHNAQASRRGLNRVAAIGVFAAALGGCRSTTPRAERSDPRAAPVSAPSAPSASAAGSVPAPLTSPFAPGACPGPAQVARSDAPPQDQSQAMAAGGAKLRYEGTFGTVERKTRDRLNANVRRFCGRVIDIDIDDGDVAVVVAERNEPVRFELEVGGWVIMPFEIGDAIVVHFIGSLDGAHWVEDAMITDERGALLVGDSRSGSTGIAPGWSVSRRRVVRDSPEASQRDAPAAPYQPTVYGLSFVYRGRRANVAPGEWRELRVDGELWAMGGSSHGWTGPPPPSQPSTAPPMPRPHDMASYDRFTIVRQRE